MLTLLPYISLETMLILRRFYSRFSPSRKYIYPAKKDPGIYAQSKLLQEPEEDVETIDFDELESDFMGVHQSHKEHIKQMKQWNEKEKYLIVKQRYFKVKCPNFLTWNDKEQIRYLHSSDPQEWTIEKLSEGFPALPDVIEKIVKGKWSKQNKQKITNHDKAVIQNWSEFKQGRLNNLPAEIKVHLQKFSDRSLNLKPFKIKENSQTQNIIYNCEKKTTGEFSEIIASYERLKKEKKDENNQLEMEGIKADNIEEENDVSSRKRKSSNRLITFKQLQSNINHAVAVGKPISVHEELILNNTESGTGGESTKVELQPEEISAIVERKNQINYDKVGFVRKTTRDMSHLIYPEKITIPQKYFKKGYTYKLNDCYYDSDGEFLYRVPGMD